MIKAFIINHKDESEFNVCVIADTPSEAKAFAITDECLMDSDYINLRACRCDKNSDLTGLTKGIMHDFTDALRRGFFSRLNEYDCPECKSECVTV